MFEGLGGVSSERLFTGNNPALNLSWSPLNFNQKSYNALGRVRVGPAFLSWRHYIDTMIDFCLKLSKYKALKMLDLHTKSAIKLV